MNREITHARIKYMDNQVVDIISIDKIIEFKKTKPSNIKDFAKEKVYKVEYTDKKNPQPVIVKALIADLACGEDEVSKLELKRPIFGRIHDSDVPNTSDMEDSDSENSNKTNSNEKMQQSIQQIQKINTNKRRDVKLGRALSILESSKKRSVGSSSDPEYSEDSENENDSMKKRKYLEDMNTSLEDSVKQKDNEIKRLLAIIEKQKSVNGGRDPASTSRVQVHAEVQKQQEISSVSKDSQKDKRSLLSPQRNHEYNENEREDLLEISPLNSPRLSNPPSPTPNEKLLEISPPNSPRLSNPPSPTPNGKLKCHKNYINKFIIESVEYYKASEGHGFNERKKRYTPLENGELYLGEGRSMNPVAYQLIKLEKPRIFLRDILEKIWDRKDLANRALDNTKVTKQLPNRSPVKQLETHLLRLTISIFNDYLEKQPDLSLKEKAKFLRQTTNIISQKIKYLKDEELKADKKAAMRRLTL